ncbi:MAG: flavin monoamine oxidase family protein [Spirosomataceae bacterium]
MHQQHILIIGGGLSGLATALRLQEKGISFQILEAQPRLGGRIFTQKGMLDTPMDLGATWISEEHTTVLRLLEKLEIPVFEQFASGTSYWRVSPSEPARPYPSSLPDVKSFRVEGGTEALIQALESRLPSAAIQLQKVIQSIQDEGNEVICTTRDGEVFRGTKVICTISPEILIHSVTFSPALPSELAQFMNYVQTWMSGSIKYAVEFTVPFWRERGFSGTAFSHVDIATEMYDHTNAENTTYSLMGFLNPKAKLMTQHERKEAVLSQIRTLFGECDEFLLDYYEKIWDHEFVQVKEPKYLQSHQNNGHPVLQRPQLGNKLYFSGTETSYNHPGYMEGAVVSANRVSNQVLTDFI